MNQYILDANILFSGVISQKPIYRAMFDGSVFYTHDKPLRDGLIQKGYLRVQLFNEFIAQHYIKREGE